MDLHKSRPDLIPPYKSGPKNSDVRVSPSTLRNSPADSHGESIRGILKKSPTQDMHRHHAHQNHQLPEEYTKLMTLMGEVVTDEYSDVAPPPVPRRKDSRQAYHKLQDLYLGPAVGGPTGPVVPEHNGQIYSKPQARSVSAIPRPGGDIRYRDPIRNKVPSERGAPIPKSKSAALLHPQSHQIQKHRPLNPSGNEQPPNLKPLHRSGNNTRPVVQDRIRSIQDRLAALASSDAHAYPNMSRNYYHKPGIHAPEGTMSEKRLQTGPPSPDNFRPVDRVRSRPQKPHSEQRREMVEDKANIKEPKRHTGQNNGVVYHQYMSQDSLSSSPMPSSQRNSWISSSSSSSRRDNRMSWSTASPKFMLHDLSEKDLGLSSKNMYIPGLANKVNWKDNIVSSLAYSTEDLTDTQNVTNWQESWQSVTRHRQGSPLRNQYHPPRSRNSSPHWARENWESGIEQPQSGRREPSPEGTRSRSLSQSRDINWPGQTTERRSRLDSLHRGTLFQSRRSPSTSPVRHYQSDVALQRQPTPQGLQLNRSRNSSPHVSRPSKRSRSSNRSRSSDRYPDVVTQGRQSRSRERNVFDHGRKRSYSRERIMAPDDALVPRRHSRHSDDRTPADWNAPPAYEASYGYHYAGPPYGDPTYGGPPYGGPPPYDSVRPYEPSSNTQVNRMTQRTRVDDFPYTRSGDTHHVAGGAHQVPTAESNQRAKEVPYRDAMNGLGPEYVPSQTGWKAYQKRLSFMDYVPPARTPSLLSLESLAGPVPLYGEQTFSDEEVELRGYGRRSFMETGRQNCISDSEILDSRPRQKARLLSHKDRDLGNYSGRYDRRDKLGHANDENDTYVEDLRSASKRLLDNSKFKMLRPNKKHKYISPRIRVSSAVPVQVVHS